MSRRCRVGLACVALGLAACGGDEAAPANPPAESPAPQLPQEPPMAPPPVPPPAPPPSPASDTGPWTLDLAQGEALFIGKCQRCHGEGGGGGYGPALTSTATCVPCGEFTAVIRIFNFRGVPVPAWRLAVELPPGHLLTRADGAVLRVTDTGGVLSSAQDAALIPHGHALGLPLHGRHSGQVAAPLALRLEASPCFTSA